MTTIRKSQQDPFTIYSAALARTRASALATGSKELEHQFRPALKQLLESILSNIQALNEPGKSEFGMPDFALIKNRWPIGYVETKRLDANLDEIAKGEQMKRYFGYANLVLTNYLEFHFYKHGNPYGESIAIINSATITPDYEACKLLQSTFAAFLEDAAEPVRRAETLARIMGENAKRLRGNLLRFLKNEDSRNRQILEIYDAFKTQLIHDLTIESFTDMYAQTLVYGFFVARYYDETPMSFDHREARDLIPATNPLLRRFFDHITGADFDLRLEPIVNELCKVFENADVKDLMRQLYRQDLWGGTQNGPDPVVHFYEDFLREYDADQRKRLGAFYTPPPVVRFIVRSVDAVLKRDFSLMAGLADTSKIEISRVKSGKAAKESVHKVQVLDPATGTGTFLTEVIRLVRSSFDGQEGRFPKYVNDDLLPRLHGFELMMAPYTIAHLKIGATLAESGAKDLTSRLGIYLTNSLEKGTIDDGSLFATLGLSQAISNEAREASVIKNEMPIMVVIGNPPYSVSSNNPSIVVGTDGKKHKTWIGTLIDDYKKDLGERKINLDDDYIKFIRLAEHFIEKNGIGAIAMITNNSYIDGITHRQMRKHLLETFDEIYILDLHGNSKKKEKSPDGTKDDNVFDIMQGVAICILVRKEAKKKGLGTVYHAELWGRRADKLTILDASSIENVEWQMLEAPAPNYFFVPKDFVLEEEYKRGFILSDIFNQYGSGIITRNDDLTINFRKEDIISIINDFKILREDELRNKYGIRDGVSWKLKPAQEDVIRNEMNNKFSCVLYRPFDTRHTLYTQKSSGFLNRPVFATMHNMLSPNLAIATARIVPPNQNWDRIFVSNSVTDIHSVSDQTYVFHLYTYLDDGTHVPNLKKGIVTEIEKVVGATPPEDIFDYIYAVLHSPGYREKYKEFLKIDFPRVPYPRNREAFDTLAKLGKELRELHLLESPKVRHYITSYPTSGSNAVDKITRDSDKVYINAEQYFGEVPEVAWNFYIGGYQPAQKWLKDRKGRALSNDDIEHYQQMIVALSETGRIMGEIDKIVQGLECGSMSV